MRISDLLVRELLDQLT